MPVYFEINWSDRPVRQISNQHKWNVKITDLKMSNDRLSFSFGLGGLHCKIIICKVFRWSSHLTDRCAVCYFQPLWGFFSKNIFPKMSIICDQFNQDCKRIMQGIRHSCCWKLSEFFVVVHYVSSSQVTNNDTSFLPFWSFILDWLIS